MHGETATHALRDQQRSFEIGKARHDRFQQLGTLASTAALYAELGRVDEARELAVQVPPLVREIGLHGALTRLALFADELGIHADLVDAAATKIGPRVPRWRELIEHILAGELDAAADIVESTGNVTIGANLRRHRGLRLMAAGQTSDAVAELERTLAFYRSVDASAYVAEIETALASAQSESA